MKKNVVITLIALVLLLTVAVVGALGYLWYQENHLFVEDAVYPVDAQSLDLRGQDISFSHYDMVHWQLPGCEILWDVPFQGGKYPNNSTSLSVSSLTNEDLDILYRYFPNLTQLDATGCRDYAVLEKFRGEKPDCQLIYQVDLGGVTAQPDAVELTLGEQDYDLDTLRANLAYLPQVSTITLTATELTAQELSALREEFAHITFQTTVEIRGREYSSQTTELSLVGMTSGEVDEVCQKLGMLTGLTYVELMADDGSCSLEKADVKKLRDAAPGVGFHYVFDFYGHTISASDEEVVITKAKIGDEGVDEVRAALDMMEGCKRFVLDSCGLSNELLAELREEYRDKTKVVWRASFAKGSALTDVDVIYVANDLKNSNCENLIYFEDVRYLDAGHNESWSDASFVAGMPKLEVAIISGSSVEDLSGFANCKKLRVLETGYCGYIKDITPLAQCESLEMLNISFTSVKDLSALDGLNVKNVCALNTSSKRVPQAEQQRFQALKPDCETHYVGSQPYGSVWRYERDNDIQMRQWYQEIDLAFDYAHYARNFSSGWYLDEEGKKAS